VRVRVDGASFFTVERASQVYPGGEVGRVAFALRGRFVGPRTALGTVRLVGRFYRGEQEVGACDSLDVPWAAGTGAAARLGDVVLGHQVDAYYPAVPSLVRRVSPARARFIGSIDAICVRTYNWGRWAQQVAHYRHQYFDDRAFLDFAFYASWHAWQLRAISRVGQPPQAQALYRAWLANFRQRVLIEQRAVALYEQNHRQASRRAVQPLAVLKTHGNLLGQRFGLTRCTSNGDRTPVPILDDGQPPPLL
jgi:hypothetical protein